MIICVAASFAETAGWLSPGLQALGWTQWKASALGLSSRLHGLDLAGKGLSNGGSIGIDFSSCAFYPAYTPHQQASRFITKVRDSRLGVKPDFKLTRGDPSFDAVDTFFHRLRGHQMQIALAETEALLQLTIALNFAFAAFDSLRSPVQARMRRLARETHYLCVSLAAELRDLHYVSTLGWPEELSRAFRSRTSDYSKVIMHMHNLRSYETVFEQSNEDWSFSVGRFAIVVGIVGLVILATIPVLSDQFLSLPFYLFLFTFLLSPTALLIFYNLSIGQMMRDSVKDIETMRQEIFEIEGRLKSEYRPTLRQAKKMKLIPED